MAVGQEEGRKIGRWEGGRSAAWQDERMEGWEDERTGGRRGEEGWREEEDEAVYHDSLERVCPRQTPSRSPSPGRRYVSMSRCRTVKELCESKHTGTYIIFCATRGSSANCLVVTIKSRGLISPCPDETCHRFRDLRPAFPRCGSFVCLTQTKSLMASTNPNTAKRALRDSGGEGSVPA